MKTPEVLYIGNFRLPDQNAAAHRVINIGKSLRDLGFIVVYFGVGEYAKIDIPLETDGFRYYNVFSIRRGEFLHEEFCISHIKRYIKKNQQVRLVIAYNYPSIALMQIKGYCRRRGIRIIADCTEWYNSRDVNPLKGILKGVDSAIRMRFVHKRLDGVIAISSYLENYYSKWIPTQIIPPTVDINAEKFHFLQAQKPRENGRTVIVYSGVPSASKEALDRVVECMAGMIDKPVELQIVGITEEQYIRIYRCAPAPKNVVFLGRLTHRQALETVAKGDYALIIRPNNRLTQAGFPTKFAEAISCGTPVIATRTSDLEAYISDGINGFLIKLGDLASLLNQICSGLEKPPVDRSLFHYECYTQILGEYLEHIGVKACLKQE